MAFSIESRVPFLTTELADYVSILPEEFLIDMGGNTKSVLRAALRGIVPDTILDRRDKIGFATAEFTWLQGNQAWIRGLFQDGEWRARLPLVVFAGLLADFDGVFAGRRRFGSHLWRMINVRLWVEEFNLKFS